jgi:hypothetical protein
LQLRLGGTRDGGHGDDMWRIIRCMFAWAELAGFLILLTALTPVLGDYLARVFEGPPAA